MRMTFVRSAVAAGAFALAPTLAAAQQCTSDARSVVDAVYRQVLERGATGVETSRVASQLESGQLTVRELVETVATSGEHRQRFGGGLNADAGRRTAVSNLYRHVLGREADPGGLQTHVDALGRSSDATDIARSLVSSAEYSQRFGQDTVPGQNVRLCAATNGRSRNDDRNRSDDRSGVSRRYPDDRQSPNDRQYPNEGRASARGNGRYEAFDDVDANGDGAIDRNEWWWSRRSFDRYDSNGNGVVTRREFSAQGGAPDEPY